MINLPPFHNSPASPGAPDWAGLTLREIEMRRTLVQARMEIQKFKLAGQLDGIRQSTSRFTNVGSMFSRVAGVFSVAEYAFFAVKAFRFISPLFRRKRR